MKHKITVAALLVLIFAALGAVAWGCYVLFAPKAASGDMTADEARIAGIRKMTRLCTIEVCHEASIKDSIHGKWLCAKTTLNGTVSFDVDRLHTERDGDTLVVFLPPDTVEVMESTEPGAYRVLDTWTDKWYKLDSDLTTAEENAIKARHLARFRQQLRQRGYVKEARHHAVATLQQMLQALYGAVKVVDAEAQ